jgi:FtsP/CotA-like multicopper oxidase with cupredoxin domain
MFLIAADLAFTFFLFVIWGIAGFRIGRLVTIATKSRVKSKARSQLVLHSVGILLALGKIITIMLLASTGWLFVRDTIMPHLLLIVMPIAAVMALSIPRLWKIVRSEAIDNKQPMDAMDRMAVSSPALVLPIQVAGFGTLIDFILTLFFPVKSLDLWNLIIVLLIFAAVIGALWRSGKWRYLSIVQAEEGSVVRSKRRALRVSAIVLVVVIGVSSWFMLSSQASRLPDRMSMMSGKMDFGGGSVAVSHEHSGMNHADSTSEKTVSVKDLVGPQTGEPDHRFTLTTEKKTVQLSSGGTIDAWTYNGQLPGPELRVKQGDLVEVTLVNKDIDNGVTLHWHGQDVPNGEDGVSGVTQNAVMPGQTYIYRFRAEQAGSYWYHSHQESSEQVKKGLFGALIVEPKDSQQPVAQDIVVMDHSWNTTSGSEANLLEKLDRRMATSGSLVRFRLINTGNWPTTFFLSGAKFKVTAIDGSDLNVPTVMENAQLEVAAGGRYDVAFSMPDTPVLLSKGSSSAGILLSADGTGEAPALVRGPVFDPLTYGSPKATPFGPESHFDREFTMIFDNKLGFYDGTFDRLFTINGEVFPNTPMFMVKEGDLVKTTFVNRSLVPHPMHLHGHHMLVLSRNGKPVTGSPWWTDTLNVNTGEIYEVAFKADNPGVWMDHCHNLEHAAIGMTLHLSYEGVTSPFIIGHATQNKPE